MKIYTIFQNIIKVCSEPSSLFTLLAVLLLILGFLYIKKVRLTRHTIVYVGLMLALSIILHQFRIWHMPQGGSVTLGAMLPLILVSYRYGVGVGALGGFVYGMINLIQDPFLLHPLQVIFDYPLPYMVLGLAGISSKHRMLSTVLAFLARFTCHFISGAVFFGSYAPSGTSPYLYALTFNATYLLPEFLICFALLKVLPIPRLLEVMDKVSPRNF